MGNAICSCREAGKEDFEEIAELFRRNAYGLQRPEWLRWKYLDNPDGLGTIFVAVDSNGAIIGLRGIIPRLFRCPVEGTFVARNGVDWFIAPEYRGKGVHSRLREFLLKREDFSASIGFPNKLSRKITRTLPEHNRVYFPIDEWLYPILPGILAKTKPYSFLAPPADALSRLHALLWLGRRPRNIRMQAVNRFQQSYSLDTDCIHGVRSADYLNWRFIDNPMYRFSAWEFLEDRESIGYCVYARVDSSILIYDLALSRRKRACFRLLVDHFRDEQISHLHFRSVGFRLGRFGFFKRDSTYEFDICNTPQGKWLVTLADKD